MRAKQTLMKKQENVYPVFSGNMERPDVYKAFLPCSLIGKAPTPASTFLEKSLRLIAFCLLFFAFSNAVAQNPLNGNQGFQILTEGNLTFTGYTHVHGALGVGGNLVLNCNGVLAEICMDGVASYIFPGDGSTPTGLLVKGGVTWTNGGAKVLEAKYIHIGNSSGCIQSDNGVNMNTQILPTGGTYNQAKRIEGTLDQTPNPSPFQSVAFDFATLFSNYRANAAGMAACTNNVQLYNASNVAISGNTVSSAQNVQINSLANGVNILNLTTTSLNNMTELKFNAGALPGSSKLLVINVPLTANFTWNNCNLPGLSGSSNGAYIIWNFSGTTTYNLTINQSALIIGTIFAPNHNVIKTGNGDIDGNMIAKTLSLGAGEVHLYPFNGNIPLCSTCSNVTSAGTINASSSGCGDSFDPALLTEGTAPSGGSGTLEYQWQSSPDNATWTNISGATSQMYDPPSITATTYYRRGVRRNGCTSYVFSGAVTVTVNSPPVPSVSGTNTICSGSATSLTASGGGTYAWDNGGNTASITVTPSSTMTYTVTVTNASGCTAIASYAVTVNPSPVPNAGADVTICKNNLTTLTASASGATAPYTYNWSNGLGSGASKSVSPSTTTTYTVTVTSANGCISTDQVTVTAQDCVENCSNGFDDDYDGLTDCADADCGPMPNLGGNISICSGSSANLFVSVSGGQTPYTYAWNNGLGNGAAKTVTPAVSTTYAVTVTSLSGCTGVTSVTVSVNNCTENCTDGIDNDSDGLIDCADPGCAAISAPILANDAYATCPGMAMSDRVTYNDGNLQSPQFTIVSNPTHGSVTIDWTGKFIYTPNTFECTTDQFVYQVCNQPAGCCSQATVTITLGDNSMPTLIDIPSDILIDCDDAVPSPPVVTAFDQCPGIYIDYEETSSQNVVGACDSYSITRTWTATDFCGNSTSSSQIITVQDQSAPQIFRVYTLENGKKVVAGIANDVNQNWKYVRFPISFKQAPVILTQLTSANDPAAVSVQQRFVSRQGFEVRVLEEEAANGLHGDESVAWVAFEPGSNAGGIFEYQAGAFSNVGSATDTMFFSPAFAMTPQFLASAQTTNESDPATLRTSEITGTAVVIHFQEEDSADPESLHANETIGYLAIAPGASIADENGEVFGEAGMLNLTNAWATVNLAHRYTQPVVVAGGLSFNDAQPLTIRVRNVTANSFQVSLQEWDYLNGNHSSESVSWMVLEGSIPGDQGYYCSGMANNLVAGVNLFAIDNCDEQIAFGFNETETLLAAGLLTTRTWTAEDNCGNETISVRLDTCGVAAVKLKTILQGAFVNNANSGLMRDNLRSQNLVPVLEPYSDMAQFPHVVNQHKMVTICHNPGQNDQQTLEVEESALDAHLSHGDALGECVALPPPPPSLPPGAAAAQYRTIADGDWNNPTTWLGGNVPPGDNNVNNKTISIEHHVLLNSSSFWLKNGTSVWVSNGSLRLPVGEIRIQSSSFIVNNATVETTIGSIFSWTGTTNIFVKNAELKIGGDFVNENGIRKMENVCLTVGQEFTCGNAVSRDTLINVTATIGSNFRVFNQAKMHAVNCAFRVANGNFSNELNSTLTGSNTVLLIENGALSNLGNWSLGVSKYCISGTLPTQLASYFPNSEECANISVVFTSCNAFSAVEDPGASGSGNNGGNNSAGSTTTAGGAIAASEGILKPALLDVTGSTAVVDWMLVELRSFGDDKDIIAYATVLMKRDGRVVSENGDSIIVFPGVPEDDYYVVLRHRNHLPLMTNNPHFLTVTNPPLLDFTDPALAIRGNGGNIQNGKRLMWSGDFNGDNKVIYQGPYNDVFHLFSRVLAEEDNTSNLANFIVQGYESDDFNLDGKVIFQGPNNDRAPVLYYSVLAHTGNTAKLANYIVSGLLP
jgi:choice-of-anchor A domain-containing protein